MVKITRTPPLAPPPLPTEITLVLDEFTAKVLFSLVGRVGGSGPKRDAIDALWEAFVKSAGFKFDKDMFAMEDDKTMYFEGEHGK